MESVDRAAMEARELGASDNQLIRLLMRSLPDKYNFMEYFVSEDKRSTYETFREELYKVLGNKIQNQMSSFITSQRRPGEHVLLFFFRIIMLYKSANNLKGDGWQNDPAHTCSVYSKLHDSLYPEGRAELIRRVDADLENNKLTITKLKKELTEVSKMSERKISAETMKSVNALKETEEKTETVAKDLKHEESNSTKTGLRQMPKCWNCARPGHYRSECRQLRGFQNFGRRESRDQEDGRQARNQEFRPWNSGFRSRRSYDASGAPARTQEGKRYGGRNATGALPQ